MEEPVDPTEETKDVVEDVDRPVERTVGADFTRGWVLARLGFRAEGAVRGRFVVDDLLDAIDDGRTLSVRTEPGDARYVETEG